MSGEFRPEQNIRIEATDNEELAKRYGLTRYDEATGQWRRPTESADERDSRELAQLKREKADAEQHAAELRAALDEARELLDADDKDKAKPTTGRGNQSKRHDQ